MKGVDPSPVKWEKGFEAPEGLARIAKRWNLGISVPYVEKNR
jgi:hypothetical protein